MKYSYTIGGGDPCVKVLPVRHATTDIPKGAAVMRGVSDDTNEPFIGVAAGSFADIIGVLEELVDNADTDSAIGGTAILRAKIGINPMNVYLAEYDQSDTLAETSASSTTTFNCTSIEGIAGGWLYAITGSAAGELQWVASDDTNSVVTKSAFTTTGGSDTFIKILPQFHLLAKLVTAGDKIGSDAGAGSAPVLVLENYIEATNIPYQRLDPTKHSGLDLTGLSPKFYAEILFRDHALNPLS